MGRKIRRTIRNLKVFETVVSHELSFPVRSLYRAAAAKRGRTARRFWLAGLMGMLGYVLIAAPVISVVLTEKIEVTPRTASVFIGGCLAILIARLLYHKTRYNWYNRGARS